MSQPPPILYNFLKLKTLQVHAPEPPTTRTSGDYDQTWREKWDKQVQGTTLAQF